MKGGSLQNLYGLRFAHLDQTMDAPSSSMQIRSKVNSFTADMQPISANILSVDLRVETTDSDWHDTILKILQDFTFRLAGGYYEPKSARDAKLSEELDYFVRDYKSKLEE